VKLTANTAFILLLSLTATTSITTHAQTAAYTDNTKTTERLLLERIEKLERGLVDAAEREKQLLERIDKLEQKQNGVASAQREDAPLPIPNAPVKEAQGSGTISPEDRSLLDSLQETTFNLTLDGYYGYNFNRPVGGVNLLRAYDVQSNSFSLNQAALIIENAPNLEKGKRYGFRPDLQ
jgi:hypothetical protein